MMSWKILLLFVFVVREQVAGDLNTISCQISVFDNLKNVCLLVNLEIY